jgi:hypothetical protein
MGKIGGDAASLPSKPELDFVKCPLIKEFLLA